MRTYGQYCPIARGAEIFAERWTPLIIRNLYLGCGSFSEIRKTYPGLDEDRYITADAEAFVKWHAGQLTWAQATREGRIQLDGARGSSEPSLPKTPAACSPTSGRSPAPPRVSHADILDAAILEHVRRA